MFQAIICFLEGADKMIKMFKFLRQLPFIFLNDLQHEKKKADKYSNAAAIRVST